MKPLWNSVLNCSIISEAFPLQRSLSAARLWNETKHSGFGDGSGFRVNVEPFVGFG